MNQLQQEIITRMGVKPSIDSEVEVRRSIDFIKSYFAKHHFLETAVLGISGGQDSTLVGKLAQMAMTELREETGNNSYEFIGMVLPYGKQADASDVTDALRWISPDRVITVNIKSSVDALEETFEAGNFPLTDFNKGNVKARMRMIAQYAVAGDTRGVVLGTDHAAESTTGFFTKFGDGASDILPIFRLNKRQGRQLLEHLGAPEHLVHKIPTADLEDDQPMQPDEEALGVSYDDLDDYLEGKAVSKEAQKRIEQLYLQSEHKRRLPVTIFDDFWHE